MKTSHVGAKVGLRRAQWLLLVIATSGFAGLPDRGWGGENDTALRQLLTDQSVQPLSALTPPSQDLFELGRSLFFDHELSGNRNISCASCHHPSLSSGDSRSLPSGTGGQGLGPDRTQSDDRETVPRNAPDVFDRGDPKWTSMFWDSRVARHGDAFTSPAGGQLPADLKNVLAVQALFPVTSRAEMRGNAGDLDRFGQVNELANIADSDLPGIWSAIMDRLLAIPDYRQAFAQAYPNVPSDQLGIEHVASAIGEFEGAAFSTGDSKWDRYLAGDNGALSEAAKRGAVHFYSGNCAACHSGSLLTDQQHHNLGVPQLGPGKDPLTQLDPGRALETGDEADEFAFRTPPLRNVMLTGPWMHNGAFHSLEDVIRHKYDPVTSLANYDVRQLDSRLQSTVRLDEPTINAITRALDPLLPIGQTLSDDQLNDLMAFLFSMTSPSADLMLEVTPERVLSGLEVDRLPPSQMKITYDPADGQLRVDGDDSLSLDSIFVRIKAPDSSDPADFAFQLGSAVWSANEDITLSDTGDAQSFIDYREDPEFLFRSGDSLGLLLPPGLSVESVRDYLSAAYRIHGSPVLWATNVVMVPEPTALSLWLLGGVFVHGSRRRPVSSSTKRFL